MSEPRDEQQQRDRRVLRKRYRKNRRFKLYCIGALLVAMAFLAYFLVDLAIRGAPAFRQAQVRAEFRYTEMSARIPKLAVREKLRPFVSRGALRGIPLRLKRDPAAEIKTRIDLDSGDPASPAEAVRPPGGLDSVARDRFRELIGPEGLTEVRAELRGDHEPVTEADEQTPGVRWVWASKNVDRYLRRKHRLTQEPVIRTERVTWSGAQKLPAGSAVELQLLGLSRDAPPEVVAAATVKEPGATPISPELRYDPAGLRVRRYYALRALAKRDGEVTHVSSSAPLVITAGHPKSGFDLSLRKGAASALPEPRAPQADPEPFALSAERRALVDRLENAGAARRKFNHRMGTKETRWVAAVSEVDQYLQLPAGLAGEEVAEHTRLGSDERQAVDALHEEGVIAFGFNSNFFTNGSSQLPEQAGVFSAAVGSIYVLGLVLLFSFPIGVLTAIYLEEFAPDNKVTQIIEININNLAAIPSILFGVLGLLVFINIPKAAGWGDPRQTALVAGLTLSLMTLPIIVISSRAALRAVPEPIRLGAMSMGATRWQTVCHHVLPQAIPGILTGTIIGLAQAIGETAPLIVIGLVAFIPDTAASVTDPTTVLPAQIFKWSTNSQSGFVELTAAGILVLLAVLLTMNAAAVLLRARFEKRW